MQKIDPKQISTYWKKTAKRDFETMRELFQIKRYSEALFFGHIVLEKILKACVVTKTKLHAPYTHDLVKLHDIAELGLQNDDLEFLNLMNDFNIRSRYPDFKLNVYKQCTREFTQKNIEKINLLYQRL